MRNPGGGYLCPSIASRVPFGFGQQKPHHYREMLRVLWDNWPEANGRLDQVVDPESGEPDYNVLVSVHGT